MNQTTDGIVAYLNVLHTHRQLVADAYHNNSITLSEDNQRAIRQLQQHRVLFPYLQDEFRLAPSLIRHLDEAFQRQRNYALSSNFAEQFNRLLHLSDEYLKASHENRPDDGDTYEADFDAGVFELRESIESNLLLLRTLTDNRFANVNTLAEKQRQNDYYIQQAEKLGDVFIALQADASLLELLQSSSLLSSLLTVYQHQLLAKLPEWRANLLDITATLKNYLYRLRQIEPEARRVRTFAHFLNRNRDYQPPDVEDLPQLPAWAARFEGLRLKLHPDLSDNATRAELEDVAHSLPAAKLVQVRERKAGKLLTYNEAMSVVVLEAKPVQRAFYHYLASVGAATQPLSALQWKRGQIDAAHVHISDEAWLLYVLHATQTLQNYTLQRIEAPLRHAHAGNIVITDMLLWKKT